MPNAREQVVIGSRVIVYQRGDWYNEGKVISIEDRVKVDFDDWIQSWNITELIPNYIMFRLVFIPNCPGILETTF